MDTARAGNIANQNVLRDVRNAASRAVMAERLELAGLRHAVRAKPAFIGLLGSSNKAKEHKRQLRDEGLDASTVDAIRGPIGLKIGGVTVPEIAVSILAQYIQRRAGVLRNGETSRLHGLHDGGGSR